MKVLFVCNNVYIPGNGISTSVRETVAHLREAGVDARFLSGSNRNPEGQQPDFPLKPFHFPIFQPIVDANGFSYASVEKKKIREAVEWADIIHISEPLFLQEAAIKIAEQLGKPVVGTFHLYTQNILMEIPFASWKWTNHLLMLNWRRLIFDHCSDVQCPTSVVKKLLEKYNFKGRLHVISNGIKLGNHPVEASKPQSEPYLILNTGRYTNVKGQSQLLEAMRYSKHSREIQLHFAGNGVKKEELKRLGKKLMNEGVLKYEPAFEFHNHAQLMELAHKAWLYVHCASLEVEGLGCIEALREGTVPVIARGELIGTTDFALDERSIYECGDVKELAAKIDWWIEHPQERIEMGRKYVEYARSYDIHKSIESLIEMYKGAIESKAK